MTELKVLHSPDWYIMKTTSFKFWKCRKWGKILILNHIPWILTRWWRREGRCIFKCKTKSLWGTEIWKVFTWLSDGRRCKLLSPFQKLEVVSVKPNFIPFYHHKTNGTLFDAAFLFPVISPLPASNLKYKILFNCIKIIEKTFQYKSKMYEY